MMKEKARNYIIFQGLIWDQMAHGIIKFKSKEETHQKLANKCGENIIKELCKLRKAMI